MVSGVLALAGCGGGEDDAAAPEQPAETTATTQAPEQPPTVDVPQLEKQLERIMGTLRAPALPATVYPEGGGAPEQKQFGGGRIKVRSVECPEPLPVERGGSFSCDVVARNTDAGVRLKQQDADGKKFRYVATLKSEAQGIPVTTRLRGSLKLK